jgi:hypothetical protein
MRKNVLSRRGVSLYTGLRQPAPALSPQAIERLDAYLAGLPLAELASTVNPDG